MKKNILGKLTIFGFILINCVFLSQVQARQKKFKLATLAPKGTTYYRILKKMAQTWAKAPGGGVKITIFPDGSMGGEGAMVSRLRVGQIQLALMTAAGLAEIDQSVSATQNLPMAFRNFKEAEYVRNKMRPIIEKKFKEKGFILLSLADVGWVRFFTTKKAVVPEDFKQFKIYAWSGDEKAIELWKAAGYRPAPLDATDIITGLKTGLCDAVPAPPTYANAGQFFDSAPHMLEIKWAPLVGGLVITQKAWDKTPVAARKILAESAAAAGKELMFKTREENRQAVKAMEKCGLKVHKLNPEQEALWRTLAAKTYPAIRGKIVPAELFDQVMSLLAKYRKQGK